MMKVQWQKLEGLMQWNLGNYKCYGSLTVALPSSMEGIGDRSQTYYCWARPLAYPKNCAG